MQNISKTGFDLQQAMGYRDASRCIKMPHAFVTRNTPQCTTSQDYPYILYTVCVCIILFDSLLLCSSKAGSGRGSLFGRGLYFAEPCSDLVRWSLKLGQILELLDATYINGQRTCRSWLLSPPWHAVPQRLCEGKLFEG